MPFKRVWEFLFTPDFDISQGIDIFGHCCRNAEDFHKHAFSRPFITFRRHFLPSKTNITTDAGFGCLFFTFFKRK